MIERLYLSTVLLVAAVIWGIFLILDGVAVSISWLHHLSVVTGILLILLAAFDLFLWRIRVLSSWFVKRPVLNGTWRAELRSDWRDPKTGEIIGPISAFMVVRQTFSQRVF